MGMAVQCSNFNHPSLKSFRDAKMCCKDFQLKLDRWKEAFVAQHIPSVLSER